MSLAAKCRTCGTSLLLGAQFCTGCGTSTAIRCSTCNRTIDGAARYCPHCGVIVAAVSGMPDAERRQLTVLFCDLVGSTPLGARLDPEEMHGVVRAYQNACSAVLPVYDGYLARFVGDGVLAYFGYPHAHEDDAERAVRAGLDMLSAVSQLKTPTGEALAARVGIATGTVVVGDLIGSGESQQRNVVGDAPNLADRIKGLAEPGTVAIAPSTRRLLGRAFELRELGHQVLKGYAVPIEAWAVVGEAQSESRFEAARTSNLTDFVGREQELKLLLNRKELAWRGQGQIVLIEGEAGIGKSRLTQVLSERIAGEVHTRLRYQCSPYHSNSALFPFTTQIARAAGVTLADAPEQYLDKLERMLLVGGQVPSALIVPLFAALLSVPLGNRYAPLDLSARQQRSQTFAALLDQLELQARQRPLLIIFEDLHWADATSLELLALAAKRIEQLPVLAILTSRADVASAWTVPTAMTTFSLGRLQRADALAIVHSIAGQTLPDSLVTTIVERSDGIPLFIEESTKAMLEASSVGGSVDHRVVESMEALTVPMSLRDSLMARLDRLSPVKDVAQIASVIGREFSFTLLRAVTGMDEGALQAALGQLEKAGLISSSRDGTAEPTYVFKHALTQEAAYESLLRSRRIMLHTRIAEVICDGLPDFAEKEPEVVARHFTQARLADRASEWWQKAGERALRRSAYIEAVFHLKEAIGIAETMSPSPARQKKLLSLHVTHGQALIAQRGYAAPETTTAFVRARELVGGIDDATERLSTYAGLWTGSFMRGELAPMLEMASALLREAEAMPGTSASVIAHRIFGTTRSFQGDFTTAKHHLEKAVATYNPERDGNLAHRFGHDIGVAAEFYLALTLWPLGEIDQARRVAASALERAQHSEHRPTMAFGHAYTCIFGTLRGRPAEAAPHAEALVSIGNQHGMEWWSASGIFFRGWTRWHAGLREAGLADMRYGMALCRSFGLPSAPPLFHALLAEAEGAEGRVDEALVRLDEILATIELSGELWREAETHRHRGNLLRQRGVNDFAEAEAALRRALDTARRQKALVYELRAALDLAGLYRDLDQRPQARFVLEPMLQDLPKGLELQEVERARDLISSL
jgi:class 3 adenylate cyclase/predicted ATPase/DNA-binding transcriptional ArsR family regulator